ncbi:hypothetical protein [Escherichia coli]|uniref:hypothetical protein n=1 Tax=Escherichia coli TaxID=562 RepID=UPI0004D5031F|nr:hypothetical protein [Escherichia coli]KDX89679.1 putative membrane protein [Escherichia coli 2-316-03_S3_C1]
MNFRARLAPLSKESKVAIYSLFGQGIKLVSGPMILLAISKDLSLEEIGFYYTFISIIALKTLLEMGISNVLKQYIIHNSAKGKSSRGLIGFTFLWFVLASLLFFVFCYALSRYLYSDYQGSIDWSLPWDITSVAASLSLFLISIQIVSDSTGDQIKLRRSIMLSSSVYSIILFLSIKANLGLYSIPLAIFSSETLLFLFLKSNFKVSYIKWSLSDFINVLMEIKPLLQKVIVVWVFGYFYWNGFNLISFKELGPEVAGGVAFSIALIKAVSDISSSLVVGQMTIYSENIANNNIKKAYAIFYKFFIFGGILMSLGYCTLLTVWHFLPEFYLFEKLLSKSDVLIIIFYFLCVYIMVCTNNFVRCFKVEPFVKVSLFNSIFVPLSFYYSIKTKSDDLFFLPMLVNAMSMFFSLTIFYLWKRKNED